MEMQDKLNYNWAPPPKELTREEILRRIAILEATRAERKAERRARRNSYFKISRSRTWRGRNKGVDIAVSAALPTEMYKTPTTGEKHGWSRRNGKREFRGDFNSRT